VKLPFSLPNLSTMKPEMVWPLVEQALVSNGMEDETVLNVLERLVKGGKPTGIAVLSREAGAEIIEVRRENADETVILTVQCQRNTAKEVDNRKAA